MSESPYRLFDYYRYEDRQLFFGREEEVARMVGDILSARLLVLFAPSGSGKSSLLRAGVRPALEKRGCDCVFTRVGEDPVAAILQAIESLDSTATRGATDLAAALNGRPRPLVIFIDPFEELFTHFSPDSGKRKAFPEKLAQVLFDPSLRVYFVLSLRSEYFVALNEFRDAIPTIFHNNANLELLPFDDDCARAAIVGPSENPDSHFTWQPGLPETIIRDLKTPEVNPRGHGVLPITLQVVCHTLWSRLPDGRGQITKQSYLDAGAAKTIIERRVLQTLEAVPSRDRRLLCRVLRELITKDGLKRIQSATSLYQTIGPPHRTHLDALLNRFHQDLLLSQEPSRGETWVAFRHDYLAARIKPWLEEEERRLDAKRRRNSLIGAVAFGIASATAVWLWNDYHTYTGTLGAENRAPLPNDELVVSRNSRFWKFEVQTGYPRPLLQMGGVPWDSFSVPHALTDWKAVGIRLAKPARDHFSLALELDDPNRPNGSNPGRQSARANTDILGCPDIGYYWAADDKVFGFVCSTLKEGNPDAMGSAASALGSLGANMPEGRIPAVADALLAALKGGNPSVTESVILALDDLSANLPTQQKPPVIAALLAALKEGQHSAAFTLCNLGRDLPAEEIATITTTLLDMVRTGRPEHRRQNEKPADAFVKLVGTLPADRRPPVINALLAEIKNGKPEQQNRAVAAVLGMLGTYFSADQFRAVTDTLLVALKDGDPGARNAAALGLGLLAPALPVDLSPVVAESLMAAYNGGTLSLKHLIIFGLDGLGARLPDTRISAFASALIAMISSSPAKPATYAQTAAEALGKLCADLPIGQGPAVTDILLSAFQEGTPDVKCIAADALGRLGTSLPADRMPAVTKTLLVALEDKNPRVKSAAAVAALHSLGASLPADRLLAVADALFLTLETRDSDPLHTAAALGILGAITRPDRMPALTDGLLALIDQVHTSGAAEVLEVFTAKLPSDGIPAVIDALLETQKKGRSDDRAAIASFTLGILSPSVPADRISTVTQGLLAALGEGDYDVGHSASADALGRLGARLPADRIPAVTDALFLALKNSDSDVVKRAVAGALASLKTRLTEAQLETAISYMALWFLSDNRATADPDKSGLDPVAAVRKLTAGSTIPSTETLLRNLENLDSRKRTFAVHMLARRSLSDLERQKIHALRDDRDHRPWVRMAALDALMEIERERHTTALEKEAAEAEKKQSPGSPQKAPE